MKPKAATTTRPYVSIEILEYARNSRPDLAYLSDRTFIEVALAYFADNSNPKPKEKNVDRRNDSDSGASIEPSKSGDGLSDPSDIEF